MGPCYARPMNARWLVVLLLAAACAGGPRSTGGPVKPSQPGPIDAFRGLWGDYSGRCPGDYQYCRGHSQAVCCPITSRCAEDENGNSYCGSPGAGVGVSAAERAPGCAPDEIACSYRGQLTCCAGDQRCCAIDGAPACCR